MLASLLYPYDDDARKHIETWLSELEREQCICRYSVEDDQYIEICQWLKHQKIDKPTASKIPPPPSILESSRILANPLELSSEDSIKEGIKERKGVDQLAPPEGVSIQVWQDFKKHRKTLKAEITHSAVSGIEKEAKKAGWTLEEALIECCARGWRGFKAEWVGQKNSAGGILPGAI